MTGDEGAKADEPAREEPPQLSAKLRTRPLGKSGLVVSELALGTWGLSGEGYGAVSSEDADKTIVRARELGITLFDTADTYGARGGDPHAERMEKRLGRLLANDESAIICTKGGNDLDASPARKRFDRAFLRTSAQRSADRLRRKPDLYLLHHPTVATLARGEATTALEELQSEGVIRGWGVACGDAAAVRAALERGAAVVELPYNVFDQQDLHEITGEIHESKAGVLARSTLAYGLLCGTWTADKTFPEGDHRRDRWTEAELRRRQAEVAALRPLVKGEVHTIRAVALRYVLSNLLVSSAVVGVRTPAQLEANVRAIGNGPPYLSDADLAKIPAQT